MEPDKHVAATAITVAENAKTSWRPSVAASVINIMLLKFFNYINYHIITSVQPPLKFTL